MWKPAISLYWQRDALCAKPENKKYMQWFHSKNSEERNEAKNLCFSCPVRKDCLQWALEHREIWGIWGGKDEIEIRRALSVAYNGEERKRNRPPNCPYCTARPSKLATSIEKLHQEEDGLALKLLLVLNAVLLGVDVLVLML